MCTTFCQEMQSTINDKVFPFINLGLPAIHILHRWTTSIIRLLQRADRYLVDVLLLIRLAIPCLLLHTALVGGIVTIPIILPHNLRLQCLKHIIAFVRGTQ